MKKLVCAMMAAGAMMAFAEEAACEKACEAKACEKTSVPAAGQKATRFSDEQWTKAKARHEKVIAQRKAAMAEKLLAIVKKYVPEEEKAKALVKEIQDACTPTGRPTFRPPMRKAKEAAPEAK